ncbi:SPOR domain-containing protein [Nesterenkonia marinintestina]|uniref:SPOR domain-containing protein n=1 Tax=Nesterenkonia marinintestina TaxID=2979865 RepID=UPI0021BEE5A7|nr:SPOR domain-containing protein [Nesterenkonia sp. GX14115]
MAEYWYNVQTGQVEEGQQSSWSKLLGPYPTREEAAQAMQQVRANNEAWDEADEADEADEDD